MLSLSYCHLLKVYTSYTISNCSSVEKINIPWFSVLHFYLLSVQGFKRLKLGAFKEQLFRKTKGRKIYVVVRINTFTNALMLALLRLKDIPFGVWLFIKRHNEWHRNDYYTPHKIRPVQEKIGIILIFSFFKIVILNTYANRPKKMKT